MSSKEAMTESYAHYQAADEERDKVLSRICLKTSLPAVPLILLLCVALSLRHTGLVAVSVLAAILLFAATAGVIMRGIKLYKDVPPTPVRIWADSAEAYLAECGVLSLSPAIDDYQKPLTPSGFGIPYVADPNLLYSGSAEIAGRGECRVDIRTAGWKVVAYADGREIRPQDSLFAEVKKNYSVHNPGLVTEAIDMRIGTQSR